MEIKEFIKLNKGKISARLSNSLKTWFGMDFNVNEITERDLSRCRNTGKKTVEEFLKLIEEMPKEEIETPKKDSIVESVVNQFKERSKRGIEKYGTTLQENNTDNFLQHFKEELMDAILYIEKLQSMRK
jgi:hypothetical protein